MGLGLRERRARHLGREGRPRRLAEMAPSPTLGIPLELRACARQQIDFANWVDSLGRLGGFIICISQPRLRVLSNPFSRVMLGNEALDYFRFAIGP